MTASSTIHDLAALAIIFAVYLIRFAAMGPEYGAPWWLSVTTDVVLPSMAGAWLFVVASLVAIETFETG